MDQHTLLSLVALVLRKCDHSNKFKMLKTINHRTLFGEVFVKLHTALLTSSYWTVEVNGFQSDKPGELSLGNLCLMVKPPFTITYQCMTPNICVDDISVETLSLKKQMLSKC